jgi:uncharacterized protein (DUF1697 family)
MTYVALLRGINVGGNRKIEMPRLKSMFERLAFDGVRTYINSGNVIFRSRSRDRKALTRKIERAIEEQFGSPVAVVLRTVQEMERLVARIPGDWVNDPQMRCDVLFLWPEFDRRSIVKEFPVNPEVEDVRYVPGAVVWRIDSKNVSRSRRTKIFGTDLYRGLTIRNVNTVRKLAQLMEDAARSAAG